MYAEISSNKRKSILLIIFFILFIVGLGWLFGYFSQIGSYTGLAFAFFLSAGGALFGYFSGDKVALWSAGAQPIKKEDNPYLYRLVENLCIASGLPLPKIYLIQDSALNAFSTGRDPKHASVAFTTGIVEGLKNEELEGVIAHELSHIKNYDIRLMMLVVVLVGTTILFRDILWRSHVFGRGAGDRREKDSGAALFMILAIALSILAPLIAQMLKLAVSRRREFLADASGALLTRYPEGLARALEKIGAVQDPMIRATNATAHLFIASPFGARLQNGFANLFSTHPPIEARIKALREMGV